MRLETRTSLILAALCAAYAKPACAAPRDEQRRQYQPIMIDGAVAAQEVEMGDEAMIESIMSIPNMPGPATRGVVAIPTYIPTSPQQTTPVKVQSAAATPTTPVMPINVKMFSGSPGPSDCKGSTLLNFNLAKPGPMTPTCYNTPALSECAVFMANKDDGCQARLFNEPNCQMFANLAVFLDEYRPVGGVFRSIEVTCGIESVEPPPLNLPGMQLPVQGKGGSSNIQR